MNNSKKIKKNTSSQKNNAYMKFIIGACFLIIFGYLGGSSCGEVMLKRFVMQQEGGYFFLYSPSSEFSEIYRKLNSENEIDRLNGYYGLLDNQLIDEEFLIERFLSEKNELLQRTLVWLMGYCENPKKLKIFLKKIYPSSDIKIKKEILRSMSRLNYDDYINFIEEKKVEKKILDDIK